MKQAAAATCMPLPISISQSSEWLELVIILLLAFEGGGVRRVCQRGSGDCYEPTVCALICCEAGVGAERRLCGSTSVAQSCNMGADAVADTGAEVKPDIAGDQTQQNSHITLQFTSQVGIP